MSPRGPTTVMALEMIKGLVHGYVKAIIKERGFDLISVDIANEALSMWFYRQTDKTTGRIAVPLYEMTMSYATVPAIIQSAVRLHLPS